MRIGIDVGGTKIEGVVLDQGGCERSRQRVPTPAGSYEAVLESIVSLVARLQTSAVQRPVEAASGEKPDAAANPSVGVATPGFLSPEGLIRNSNLTVLNDRPVDHDLTGKLGRPVRVENDANCFVLSEATDGAAAPAQTGVAADVVFGATLGSGVGGGLVIKGQIWGGVNGSAGEWSHTTLPFWREEDGPGAGCYCGRPACIESFLKGGGLAWDHHRGTGQTLSPVEVGDAARSGDPAALATFARYEDRLGRALAGVINLLDPAVIVLGGGISNNVRIFENVPRLWERYTVARGLATRLVRAMHGDASGVRGAASLWGR